jgi:hypothetical protein
MSAPEDAAQFDAFNPRNVAPLVAWLASEDAKDVHGEVFRVGGGSVWLLGSWKTVGKVQQKATWEPTLLGTTLKQALKDTEPRKEDMAAIFAGGI